MDQVTIAIRQVHDRVEAVQEEVKTLSNDLDNLDNVNAKLQKGIRAAIDEIEEANKNMSDVKTTSEEALLAVQRVATQLSSVRDENRKLRAIIFSVLSFTVGGVTVPLMYALISKL